MIDEARLFEHSGPSMALFRWASTMKQFLVYVVFLNVLVVPWGLASSRTVGSVAIALGWLLVRMVGLGLVMVIIESSFAKLRLFRISDSWAPGSCSRCLRSSSSTWRTAEPDDARRTAL